MGDLGGLAFLAQGAAGVAGMAGSYTQSQAMKAQGQYENQIAQSNARMADLQAEDALKRGGLEAGKIAERGRQIRGAQNAAYAAGGVASNAGSAQLAQEGTTEMSEADSREARNNAYREAWGYNAQASQDRYQGEMARLTAGSRARSTLLTGGLGFARDINEGAYMYNRFRVPVADSNLYLRPPSGKTMSDPRNR